MAEMSKTAKAATKKAVVNLNVPQCCGKPMQAAKMMTTTGKVRGMMWLCDKCWKEKAYLTLFQWDSQSKAVTLSPPSFFWSPDLEFHYPPLSRFFVFSP